MSARSKSPGKSASPLSRPAKSSLSISRSRYANTGSAEDEFTFLDKMVRIRPAWNQRIPPVHVKVQKGDLECYYKHEAEKRKRNQVELLFGSMNTSHANTRKWKDLPNFKLDIEFEPTPTSRIAFGTTQDRKYFPEDCGNSRFGIAFAAAQLEAIALNPTYMPQGIGFIMKPVSTKGYGIGHLLSSRFEKDSQAEYPPPWHYEPRKPSCCKDRRCKEQERKATKGASECTMERKPTRPRKMNMRNLAIPGPGTYELMEPQVKDDVRVQDNFLTYRDVQGGAKTFCDWEYEYVDCYICKEEIYHSDFYRSRFAIVLPKGRDKVTGKLNGYVSLCRECYWKAVKNGHSFWTKNMVKWLFEKTRHCSYLHDHYQLPSITFPKVACNRARRLELKEARMGKYFPDACVRKLYEVKRHRSYGQSEPAVITIDP